MKASWLTKHLVTFDDPAIRQKCGLSKYTVPDPYYQPDVVVYFDFLRKSEIVIDKSAEAASSYSGSPYVQRVRETLQRYDGIVSSNRQKVVAETYDDMCRFFASAMFPMRVPTSRSYPGDKQAQMFINQALRLFITDVSTTLSRNGNGSAEISLRFRTQRNIGVGQTEAGLFFKFLTGLGSGDYDVYGKRSHLDQIFQPHTWVYVFMRSRFEPQYYYQVFTGLTTTVTANNQRGFESIQIACEDTTKLLRISHVLLNPAIFDPTTSLLDQQGLFLTSIAKYGMDLDDLLKLAVLGYRSTQGLGSPLEELQGLGTDNYVYMSGDETPDKARSITTTRRTITELNNVGAMDQISNARRALLFWGKGLSVYRTILNLTIPTFSNEYANKYEMARELCDRMFYEFYADACGNFVAHPYRLAPQFLRDSMVTSAGAVIASVASDRDASTYVIGREELLGFTPTLSDMGIATAVAYRGEPPALGGNPDTAVLLGLVRLFENYDLIRRFGYRRVEVSNPMLNQDVNGSLALAALAHMALSNKDLYSASASLLLRPELNDVARPVYVPDRREVFYVETITHNCNVGGEASTTLGLSFGRKSDALELELTEWLVTNPAQGVVDMRDRDAAIKKAMDVFAAWSLQHPETAAVGRTGEGT